MNSVCMVALGVSPEHRAGVPTEPQLKLPLAGSRAPIRLIQTYRPRCTKIAPGMKKKNKARYSILFQEVPGFSVLCVCELVSVLLGVRPAKAWLSVCVCQRVESSRK